MNISYKWLKDLIDIDLTAEELAEVLTRVGLAVEGIHAHGDDSVLDIDLTSNRPDCLSHLGVAREIRAITNRRLKIERNFATVPLPAVLAGDIVKIEVPKLCHRFTARIIKNVKIGPSPEWLVDRLDAIGERSINNVADITNYVMHELGQPMHSFDLDKLNGGRIVVRSARSGENITTLDEVDRKLDETMIVVCDSEKPVAIGGIMGGLDSSITESTVNVLLEVAFFKRESVRATSRSLGLATEASYRFERGVDIDNLINASNRATELICQLAGGEAGDLIDIYPTKFNANEIESANISIAVKRLTGLEVQTVEAIRILNALGIAAKEDDQTYISPSWRHDLAIEEDLIEEVARHIGYENIANELPPAYGAGEYQTTEVRKKLLRQTLVDTGFNEALSYSFIDTKFDGVFETVPGLIDERAEEKHITLQNSVIDGAVRMRQSILPGLIEAVRLNFNHQRRDLKLFELGKVFTAKTGDDSLPNERELFSLVVTGNETHENKAMAVRELDFYDAKGVVESALEIIGIRNVEFAAADVKHLRKGQSASISIGDRSVGSVGRLSDEISATYKFKQPVYVAEIDLQAVLEVPVPAITYGPLAKYPAIIRDISLLANRDITFAAISEAVIEQNFELCRNVGFVDVYEGKGLTDDERSITIRLEYRSEERTLVEDEVETMHQEILAQIERKLAIKPRFQ